MGEKITYFDLMMYVLPGAALEMALLVTWALIGLPIPPLLGSGGLFGSIAFLLIAFLLGHFVQAVAHGLPERFLKRLFWGGEYPSQIIFFKGHRIITDSERALFLEALVEEGAVDTHTANVFEKPITIGWFRNGHKGLSDPHFIRAKEAAQLAFNRARKVLQGTEAGKTVQSTEAYYQFFRGAAVAALFAGIVVWWARSAIANGRVSAPMDDGVRAADALVLIAALLFASFFLRARGAAESFVREVYRAKDAVRFAKAAEKK